MDVRKGFIAAFVAITLIASLAFSYTMYSFIGVKGMLRGVEQNVSVDWVDAEIRNSVSASIGVNISVNNPTQFSFTSYVEITQIQVNGLNGKNYQQSGTFQSGDFSPFSSGKLQFKFDWPNEDVSSLQDHLGKNESWKLWIRMLIKTAINEGSPVTLNILKMYSR
jgi:hypothetical protein